MALIAPREIFSDFVSLFFPHLCAACREYSGKSELCPECQRKINEVRATDFHQSEFAQRLSYGKKIEMATAYLYFEKGGTTQDVLHAIKYHQGYRLGRMMGQQFGNELKGTSMEQIDCLLPVPLHPTRLKERGYNQAEWICKGIADITGIPIETDVLYRHHANATQTKKGREDRWENTHNLFRARNLDKIKGKHVAIVDDVVTTGATLGACISALGTCDAKISVMALAIAVN